MPTTFQMRITKVSSWPKERTVPLTRGTNIAEAISLKHFKDEAALLAAAYGRRGVQQNRLARPLAEKGSSVEDIAKAVDGYTMGVRTAGTGSSGITKKEIEETGAALGADAVNFDAIPADQRAKFGRLFPKAYAAWLQRAQGSPASASSKREGVRSGR